MKKTVLRAYAKLIVQSGVNVQKGQEVIVHADLDQPEFVQMVVEEAYKAKAKKVTVEWNYQPLAKIHVRYQSVKTMGTVEAWQIARQEHFCDVFPCPLCRMNTMLDCCIFCWQTEGVPSHWMQNIVAVHLLESCYDVTDGIVSNVTHMELTGWVREHFQDIILFLAVILYCLERIIFFPVFLPFCFDLFVIVSFVHFMLNPPLR